MSSGIYTRKKKGCFRICKICGVSYYLFPYESKRRWNCCFRCIKKDLKYQEMKKLVGRTAGLRSKGRKLSEETKLNMKGKSPWNKGLTKEVDYRLQSISRKLTGVLITEEHRRNVINGIRKWWKENYDILKPGNGRFFKEMKGKTLVEIYGLEKAKVIYSKKLQSLLKRPTSYEQKIIDLITKNNLPFKYIGNGQEIIGYVNPDFRDTLNLNPPLVMEVYSKYWHHDTYEETRHKELCIPKENILFLSDEDLNRKDWEIHCLQKINLLKESKILEVYHDR